jgi:hypothetical protein
VIGNARSIQEMFAPPSVTERADPVVAMRSAG